MKTESKPLSLHSHSPIGSHHWAATLLSFVMRTGEYLSSHGSETKDEHLRSWGSILKTYATEINEYIHSLPDIDDESRPSHTEALRKEIEELRKEKEQLLVFVEWVAEKFSNDYAGSTAGILGRKAKELLDQQPKIE